MCRYTRSRCSKPELALTSACQRADRCHSDRSPCPQVSARGLKGSPTAAQYAAIVAAGRATRSSESMTNRRVSPGIADSRLQLAQLLQPDRVDAHVGEQRVAGRCDLLGTADEERVPGLGEEAPVGEDLIVLVVARVLQEHADAMRRITQPGEERGGDQSPYPHLRSLCDCALMNWSASVDRSHESFSGRVRPGSEESPAATLASVVVLLEKIARIQKETAELLCELAHTQNEAAIQRPSKARDPIRRLTSVQEGPPAQLGRGGGQPQQPASQRRSGWLGEPLTQREQAVLRLLATSLSLREIGQELYVSLNTVKTHTRAVYRKLGVCNRHEALQRGSELAVLPGLTSTDM